MCTRTIVAGAVLSLGAYSGSVVAQSSSFQDYIADRAIERLEEQVKASTVAGNDDPAGDDFSYVGGVGAAMLLADGLIREQGGRPLFCVPPTMNFTSGDFGKLAIAEFRSHRERYHRVQRAVGFDHRYVLLHATHNGLKAKFPCR